MNTPATHIEQEAAHREFVGLLWLASYEMRRKTPVGYLHTAFTLDAAIERVPNLPTRCRPPVLAALR